MRKFSIRYHYSFNLFNLIKFIISLLIQRILFQLFLSFFSFVVIVIFFPLMFTWEFDNLIYENFEIEVET